MSRSKSRLRVETSGDFNPRASFRRPNERHERSELSDRYANHSAAVRSAKASSSNASSKRPSSLFESPVGFEVHALSTEKSKKR
ncbi:hypothetical protein SEPCBS119000_002021 [Sporothrix epigloea]|uniref:Uncharacterized protein n=1 Tax=Sporothrix epigloea TaxID=1892477 RepID=A0ABP0DE36_9PEZI